MKFTKMHGIGNDYVYVDCFKEQVSEPAQTAIEVSDRHFGIGSDGLILIMPSDKADVRMRMFNADGSESEMCGNGVRCVAKYAYDHGLSRSNPMRVETGRGVLTLQLALEAAKVVAVTVDMGEPILESDRIPTRLKLPRVINQPLMQLDITPRDAQWQAHSGLDARITCVSMGNPHAVLYCGHVERVPLEDIGP